MEDSSERINAALGLMGSVGPKDLRAYLGQPGPGFQIADAAGVGRMIDLLLSTNANELARLRFSNLLRSWDNAKDSGWAGATARNTAGRRKLIHELLRSGTDLERRIDHLLPFYHLQEPLVIAEQHKDWYAPQPGIRDYYWERYLRYIRERRLWDESSILELDNSTRAVVERLADPESAQAYASRGLVMGYVQSGKTANFMGVVARAADAGYRLIIIFAGTWNILRNQTQRRFDKELLGKELLKNDEAYTTHPPPDWDDFLEHGANPVEIGQFTWQRLTRPDLDFRRLKAAIDTLEYEKFDKGAPIYDPINLHALPVKLLIVKKHSGILHGLVRDLKLLQRTLLPDLPTLVIDDESDQAGLNTVDPRRSGGSNNSSSIERSKTNLRIVELLRLLPRGQYVGYTATPYANALVNPDEPEDLYPKDFIVSLERPPGYMGVSDFFDPYTTYDDLDPKDDYSQPEIAYIRRVTCPQGDDDDDLKTAIRSYVLAGGLKVYRCARDPQRYKPKDLWHHTMLVHTSSRRGEHATLSERLELLWNQCAFNTPAGRRHLEQLWDDDYAKVCAAQGTELMPESFSELVNSLSDAIKRIENGNKIFIVVNYDNPEAPDFSAAPVWKIFIGGNKFSRGYTVEGLTISYYRRLAGTADTLMQMGRWFGFRLGYQDLVRVFLGVREGKRSDADLVSQFKEVCRMEERFRQEIERYVRRPGAPRITPREIPPLISVSGSLPPTARNKMFNAILDRKNFGGQRTMPTLTASTPAALDENIKVFTDLLVTATSRSTMSLGGAVTNGTTLNVNVNALVLETTNGRLAEFLKNYRWLEADYKYPERPADINLQIEFLEKEKNEIESWFIIAPQRAKSFGPALVIQSVAELMVKQRRRNAGRGFQVFGEPAHRAVAEHLAGISDGKMRLTAPNLATKSLQNKHRGVCLVYPVREQESGKVSVGFELFFPSNSMPLELGFRVRRQIESASISG